jgi:hypothetical protein
MGVKTLYERGFPMAHQAGALAAEATPRREPRFALSLSALVRTEARVVPIRLIDLSRNGAMAETGRPPPAGTRVRLAGERLDVPAYIAWVKGGRFGLAFDTPIRATELFYQLGRSREAA